MEMTREDKALFSFDLMTGFNWRDYLEKYVQVCLKNGILIFPIWVWIFYKNVPMK